jgi:hypothetical protein
MANCTLANCIQVYRRISERLSAVSREHLQGDPPARWQKFRVTNTVGISSPLEGGDRYAINGDIRVGNYAAGEPVRRLQLRLNRRLSLLALALMVGVPPYATLGQEAQPPMSQEPRDLVEADSAKTASSPSDSGPRGLEVRTNLLGRQVALAYSHPGVEKELDLVAYQKEQMRDLYYDYQKTMNELAQRFARMKQEDRSRLLGELNEKVDGELDKILLPEQRTRLRQISLQSVVPANNAGIAPFFAVLASASYCEYLEIPRETADRLQSKLREEDKKFAEEVTRLREASLERVLESLSADERKSLQDGLGSAFDFGGYELGRGGIFRRSDDK